MRRFFSTALRQKQRDFISLSSLSMALSVDITGKSVWREAIFDPLMLREVLSNATGTNAS